jgi:mannose-1-phosphate guanylyltransferase
MQTGSRSQSLRWAIVLAAGDGTRLHSLTGSGDAPPVPKQYCSFRGGPSLLELACRRATACTSDGRVVVVVADSHRQWWHRALAGRGQTEIVVQPANRGTAAGILLPLLRVLSRDPEAVVAVLPSDHWVEREGRLVTVLRRAYAEVEARPEKVVLLGMVPEAADEDLGWILPIDAPLGPRSVALFREKPGAEETARLRAAGALVNSFSPCGPGQDSARSVRGAPARSQPRARSLAAPLEPRRGSRTVLRRPATARLLPGPTRASHPASGRGRRTTLRLD